MAVPWTPEQVLSLAPDEISRKNAGELSSRRRWLRLNQQAGPDGVLLWGECQGSGADPYRCQVDAGGPAFKCSCPSRKVPCKHALGLFLLYANQPGAFETASPPDWVLLWLAKRAEQSERRASKAEGRVDGPSENGEASKAQEKRAAVRDKKIRAGLDELETWLHDLLRQGLAAAQSQPRAFWETAASRLVDAQAPGLARLVRAMPGLAVSGEGWQNLLLDQVTRLYLAMEGYRRIDSLPSPNQADLRAVVGITIKQETLMSEPGVSDIWLVLGRDVEEETGIRTQRTWLWGQSTGQAALILSFATGGAPLDTSLIPGMSLPAELVFYPGAYPLRAFVRTRQPAGILPAALPGCQTLAEAAAGYASALAAYPWMERFPVALSSVTPANEDGEWFVYDDQQRALRLSRTFPHGYTLMAFSGGRPLGLFGEWNGERLAPLSVWAEGRFYAFPPRVS